jgi:hypothetical protein
VSNDIIGTDVLVGVNVLGTNVGTNVLGNVGTNVLGNVGANVLGNVGANVFFNEGVDVENE